MTTTSKNTEERIVATTEARRHNGQCAYGEWIPLADAPPHIRAGVADEVAEAMRSGSTANSGRVEIDGETWLYRRIVGAGPGASTDRQAWAYACEHQGFGGDYAAWTELDDNERAEYEAGAAGIPTG